MKLMISVIEEREDGTSAFHTDINMMFDLPADKVQRIALELAEQAPEIADGFRPPAQAEKAVEQGRSMSFRVKGADAVDIERAALASASSVFGSDVWLRVRKDYQVTQTHDPDPNLKYSAVVVVEEVLKPR